ncbi:uncharacterized protein [Dermacentor andersoni]|uniref:uncharacterized protein n=1 Tax=Dermacentor andersoni TaxID=34620 RepID=UPI003B3A3CCF
MACSDHLCVCPSSPGQPMVTDGGLCNSTAAVWFPSSLGAACAGDANCSFTAVCLAGQCSCPPGFRPWDEHNCTAIHVTAAPATSWTTLLVLLSGAGLIILFVFCIWILVHRNFVMRWTKDYDDGKRSTTLLVWSQASVGDRTWPSQEAVSQNIEARVAPQPAHSHVSGDSGPGTRDNGQAVAADHSSDTTNQLSSLTELRGLSSAPDESFARPVLSHEEVHLVYPHLRGITTSRPPPPPSAAQDAGETQPSSLSEQPGGAESLNASYFTIEPSSGPKSELRSVLSTSPRRRRRPRGAEGLARHVAFPAEPTTSSAPAVLPEIEYELVGPTEASGATSIPWSSFGSSLDSLLGTPVVARIRSATYDAALHRTPKNGSEDTSTASASRKYSE